MSELTPKVLGRISPKQRDSIGMQAEPSQQLPCMPTKHAVPVQVPANGLLRGLAEAIRVDMALTSMMIDKSCMVDRRGLMYSMSIVLLRSEMLSWNYREMVAALYIPFATPNPARSEKPNSMMMREEQTLSHETYVLNF